MIDLAGNGYRDMEIMEVEIEVKVNVHVFLSLCLSACLFIETFYSKETKDYIGCLLWKM